MEVVKIIFFVFVGIIIFAFIEAMGSVVFDDVRQMWRRYKHNKAMKQSTPEPKPQSNLSKLLAKLKANPSSFDIVKYQIPPRYGNPTYPVYYVSINTVGIQVQRYKTCIGKRSGNEWDENYTITDGTVYENNEAEDIFIWANQEHDKRLRQEGEQRAENYLSEIALELTKKYLEPEDEGKIPPRSKNT